MTNGEIELRLATLIKNERGITNEIIELIALAKERKLYLGRGYPDLMKWLVKEYGYSHAAAYRRIQAAELKRSVPEITTMLEEGKVNLSTLAQVQTAIRAQERVSGERVSTEKKAEVLKQIEQKTAFFGTLARGPQCGRLRTSGIRVRIGSATRSGPSRRP